MRFRVAHLATNVTFKSRRAFRMHLTVMLKGFCPFESLAAKMAKVRASLAMNVADVACIVDLSRCTVVAL